MTITGTNHNINSWCSLIITAISSVFYVGLLKGSNNKRKTIVIRV